MPNPICRSLDCYIMDSWVNRLTERVMIAPGTSRGPLAHTASSVQPDATTCSYGSFKSPPQLTHEPARYAHGTLVVLRPGRKY